MGELYLLFFTIRKTGYVFSFHQRRALVCNMAKHAGRMTDQSDWFAGIVEGFEESDRHRALREIPHWTMPTRIKHRIEVFCLHVRKLYCVSKGFQRPLIFLEPRHCRSLIFRQIALWIDRRLPTFRRG